MELVKTKRKIFNWLKPQNWGIVKVYRDFENYADWVATIKREESKTDSLYNKWKLQHTKLYDIYLIYSLEEVDLQLPETVQRTKVIEHLNPINRYLDDTLGFAECLNIDFNQFEDDSGKKTNTFLIVYTFNWNKFSLKWIIKMTIILSILLYVIIHFNVFSHINTWISNLINLL